MRKHPMHFEYEPESAEPDTSFHAMFGEPGEGIGLIPGDTLDILKFTSSAHIVVAHELDRSKDAMSGWFFMNFECIPRYRILIVAVRPANWRGARYLKTSFPWVSTCLMTYESRIMELAL